MASIKLKFRPSSVKGKKGVLSYQIIHYRLPVESFHSEGMI